MLRGARSRPIVVPDDGLVDPRRQLAPLTLRRILGHFRNSTLYMFVYVSLEKITDLGDSFSNSNISLFGTIYQNGKSAYLITLHFQTTVSNFINLPSTLLELQDLAVLCLILHGGAARRRCRFGRGCISRIATLHAIKSIQYFSA